MEDNKNEVKQEEKNSKKSKKKIILILGIVLLLILIVIATFFIIRQIEYNKIQIELKQENIEIAFGEKIDVNEFLSKYEGGEIKIENNIDFDKVGEYKVVYKVTNSNGLEKTKEMIVTIKDEIKPTITLDEENISLKLNEEIDILSGVTAEDNYDKDITSEIITTGTVDTATEGTYEIKYDVKDSNNNVAETKIRIYTVKKVPTLQIGKTYEWKDSTGGNTITLKENNQVEESAWATDAGVSDYTGIYNIQEDKLIITLTKMNDVGGEWTTINDTATYTITNDNQFQREYNSKVFVYKMK